MEMNAETRVARQSFDQFDEFAECFRRVNRNAETRVNVRRSKTNADDFGFDFAAFVTFDDAFEIFDRIAKNAVKRRFRQNFFMPPFPGTVENRLLRPETGTDRLFDFQKADAFSQKTRFESDFRN